MAANAEHPIDAVPEKIFFECHKKKESAYCVCINCGKTFHKSWAERDYAGKLKIIDATRIVCCKKNLTQKPTEEITILKVLVTELQDKNRLLEQNTTLLRENIRYLEEKLKNVKEKNTKSAGTNQLSNVENNKNIREIGNAGTSGSVAPTSTATNIGNENKKTAHVANAITTNDSTKEEANFDTDFRTVTSRRQRQKKNQNPKVATQANEPETNPSRKIKRSKPQIGARECENDGFQAANSDNKKIWLFLSKVKEGVTEETIKNYIAKNTSSVEDQIQVKACIPKVQKSTKLRFMIGVNPDLKEVIYKSDFWPKGVAYERFNFGLGRNFLDRKTITIKPQQEAPATPHTNQ